MGGGFATGRYTQGFCQRCSLNFPHGELQFDGEVKGLLVCGACYDPPHPQERPAKIYDPIALRRPAPEPAIISTTIFDFSSVDYYFDSTEVTFDNDTHQVTQ